MHDGWRGSRGEADSSREGAAADTSRASRSRVRGPRSGIGKAKTLSDGSSMRGERVARRMA